MSNPQGKIKGKHKTKMELPDEEQFVEQLCEGAVEFKHSLGFGHHAEHLPSHFTKTASGIKRILPPSAGKISLSRPTSPPPDQQASAKNLSSNVESEYGEGMEIDVSKDCSRSLSIGRYRVWHPEESIVTVVPAEKDHVLPTVEEMVTNYKLPYRRLKGRDDGVGGATLFQPAAEPPLGVENAICRTINLPSDLKSKCVFPDRERWDVVLDGDYRSAKLYDKRKRSFRLADDEIEQNAPSNSSGPENQVCEGETHRKKRKEDERPDPAVDLELDYVKTGDDCVRFLMENDGRNRVKTFYCNRAETRKDFRPYDLVVVPLAEVNKNYFIISYDGVTHVEHGIGNHKNSTFIPLEEWMRSKYVFTLMRKIQFFGNYLGQKCFNIWRKHIGQTHFARIRKELVHKLFLAKPAFLASLCQVHGYVHEISQLAMLNITSNHLYNLEEFIYLQNETRQVNVAPAMELITDKVQEILTKICVEAKKQAKIYRESVRDEAELNDTIGVNLHQTRGSKVQSMVSIKQEKIERAKTYRRVMAEENMLGNFIRLADYMFVEGLTHRAITAAMEMLSLLDNSRSVTHKSSKGVFLTTVSFGETGIVFTPDEAAVLNAVNTALDGVVTVMQCAPRILHMRVFLPFLETKFVGTTPFSIIKMTPYFAQLREAIDHVIRSDFSEAQKYAQIFEGHRELFAFGESWDFEAYASEKHTVRQYREELARQREWRIELEKMRTANIVGVLHVDSRSLRNTLIPITSKTLELLKGLLTSNARKDALTALAAFQERAKQLDVRPTVLDEFVEFVKMYDKMMEGKKAALQDATVVDDMYELLHAYEVKIPTQDQVKLDDLHDVVMKYEDSLDAAYMYIQELREGMMDDLDSKVTAISEELLNLLGTLHSGKFLMPESDPEDVVTDLTAIQTRLSEIREKSEVYKGYQKLFQMAVDDMGNLTLTEKEFSLRWNVWRALNDWIHMTKIWRSSPVNTIKAVEVLGKTDEYAKDAYKMGKANKEDTVVFRLKDTIEEFKKIVPVIEEVANPALKPRHWKQIFEHLGRTYDSEMQFSTDDLLSFHIMDKIEEVRNISGAASKEYSFEKSLDKMLKDWDGVKFIVVPYKDSGTFIVGGIDEIQTILDDQAVKIISMCASPFVKYFEKEAFDWKKTVLDLQSLVDNWVQCQATWQYLGPIFGSRDIMRQMPTEGELFQTVDQTWRDVMKKTNLNPGALVAAKDSERLTKLIEANRLLELINKGVAQYLEVKRVAFPRFFFLSNDEMFEILSETKDPLRVQPHLKKCFEGIDQLKFENNLDVTAMISAEGEKVQLVDKFNPQTAQGAVEKWLITVEEQMLMAVQDQCLKAVTAYAVTGREKWVVEWPGQVVLVVSAIYWTKATTEAILLGGDGLAKFENVCNDQLAGIVELVRGQLTSLNRMTLSALVVMDVHARDTIAILVKEEVRKEGDFLWQSQLRMYWEENTCWVRMMTAAIEYGYEYLGNSSRLVITPLTDRCYRTLMGAIHLGMGGAPEGPAGTGKTETTKDLAKALARQCVVFNCSDSLDYLTMAKFFKGLASSGAWSCFDEFNRIDLEVLSVIAQQVLEIQIAVQNKLKVFTFEGTELRLKLSCNVFITMNPGYAGRSELPDNLKALFRTVAMMVPDYAMISEISLYSGGYLQARDCARKIVATYRLCSEQLSSQEHYDYGMRAVIAVLRAATNLKQRYPEEDELVLMLRSIIDVNLCKFLSQDVPLFNGIVSDLFPGVVLPPSDYSLMDKAIRQVCALMNLQPTAYFVTKIIQLYEMIIVRHGLMLVGLSYAGKTSCIKVLQQALTEMASWGNNNERAVMVATVNPKAVTMGQLYGQTDPMTQEWADGVLAVRFREQASNPSKDRKWLVLDGPVDAIWIENMNTVLDDNKKLCLPNSEIIQMSSSMNMIFEVGDLAVASPATVSRCGMVYLEPHQLGWHPLMISWIATLPACFPATTKAHLRGLFEWLINASLRFVRKSVKEISPTGDTALVVSLMRTFYSLIDEIKTEEGIKALGLEKLAIWIDSLFLFSLVWSIGATGDNDARQAFDAILRKLVTGFVPLGYEHVIPSTHESLIAPMFPASDKAIVYDFMFDKITGKWKLWSDTIVPFEISVDASFDELIIPTKDQMRYTFLLDKAIMYGSPFFLVGGTGTGKSVYINQHLLKGLSKDKFITILVCFSARTSANMVQSQIDGQLDRRKRGHYGPPAGKKCIIFVDDLNMPQPEVYGAQPAIELLRQFMDFGGWYGRDCAFRHIVDVQLVSAMGPPGGGRNLVTQRFLRHFNQVGVSQVSADSLRLIFSTILDWHLTVKNSFPNLVSVMSLDVIDATMEVYDAARTKLLPTPAKSHYTFNLRDFSRVIQGLMLQEAAKVPEGDAGIKQYTRLWVHEVLRVFYDRLVDDLDRDWLLKLMKDLVARFFKQDFDKLFSHLRTGNTTAITQLELRRCFFGDFIVEDPDNRAYDEISDIPNLISVVENYLKDFNGVSKRPMNLAIFLFAVEHVSRICRILKQPGGHMLLVGVGGSGRQSLTRLSAYIYSMEVFQVEISKGYTKTEWREDLMNMLKRAGAEPGRPSVFLFSDTQITDEGFVEDINNLLNSGEVPNMFPADEKAIIMEIARNKASREGKVLETMMEIWKYFVDKCKQNLHIMFCMSPVGQAFKDRLRQFPSLVNCCTIDWFQEWPHDALEAVANKLLKGMDLEDRIRDCIVQICKAFHETVRLYSQEFKQKLGRHVYLTPTSYLELINTFQTLLTKNRTENLKNRARYETGLDKLASSAVEVAVMQKELQALMPKLIVTVADVEKLMAVVEREKQEKVEPKKQIVLRDEAEALKQATEAKVIKDECEIALAGAMPILNEALAALDTLTVNDINYVKKLTNPPAAIKLVLEAVCVLLEVKPAKVPDGKGGSLLDYWKPSIVLLNNKDFLVSLKDYDKDNIDPKVMAKIRSTYTNNPDFTPAKAANASTAAEGLCKWVIAMDKYDTVAKIVAPKKAKLAAAEGLYEKVMEGLRDKQAELKSILAQLAKLEKELDENMAKKEGLQHEVKMCTVKIERAEQLVGGLGGERTRWIEAAKHLAEIYPNLIGDALAAAGIIAYLGAFTASYREEIVMSWMKLIKRDRIPHTPNFTFTASLGSPVAIRHWVIAGLPNDSVSVDNGIIVANSRRWPLMIDPQGQANKWIRNMERERNLQIVKLGDAGYMRTLENAIQFGLPVLLENVGEELDPALEPLLLKQIFKSAGIMCIRLGDATIEYHSDFRFYITTKLRNPHYLPETQVKVSLLNFMITKDGLSDQLLGVVVAKERPDLEQQKSELVFQGAENKRRLKELEDQILEVLSTSEGNILEDETAIKIISEAKLVGNDITVKQGLAEVTEKNIDDARKGYQSCGDYAAVLFFCISDLANIDPMYQYSLPWFVSLLVNSINSSEKCSELKKRLDIIQAHFLYSLYCNVCRSLFEKDKLLFSCLLSARLLEMDGEVNIQEWMFLLTGGMTSGEEPPNPAKDWLVDKSWEELNRLSKMDAFSGINKHLVSNVYDWRTLFDSMEPHKLRLPGPFADRLTSFQKLLVYRCIRPDKVIPAVQDFVREKLGPQFVLPPPFNLDACYKDSSSTCPLIFVLSPGSDPTAALLSYAAEKEMTEKMAPISLGQGQGPKATVMINDASVAGSWVLLQNCHLAPSWMPDLERICEKLSPETVHQDFRLWMTSYPSPKFPIAVLQNGVKMTNEPPKGLRANMLRSYHLDPLSNEDWFEGCKKPDIFKSFLFGIAFFHAVVQERRTFGPLGWNIPYGFDDGDLRISVRQLHMLINESAENELPLEALKYVTGECNYGGRVTDDKDRLLLNTLLRTVYCTEMIVPGYKLSESGVYTTPTPGTYGKYLQVIEGLPIVTMPEAFGLHPNADITKETNDTVVLLNSLLKASADAIGTGVGGARGAGGEGVAGLVKEILRTLPPNFDIEACEIKYPILYEESMNTVLSQEMTRFNKLLERYRGAVSCFQAVIEPSFLKHLRMDEEIIHTAGLQHSRVVMNIKSRAPTTIKFCGVSVSLHGRIRTSLVNMEKAIAGQILMSMELDVAYRSLSVNQVPALWSKVSYPSLKPLASYMKDLIDRVRVLRQWFDHGRPAVSWVSGFFFAQSFMTAALQNYARRKKLAIDGIAFDFFVVDHEPKDPPDEGVYITGLSLEGCGWDATLKILCESKPKVIYVPAPIIWLKPCRIVDIPSSKAYNCPCYRTAERRGVLATTGHSTNFLMNIRMPTVKPAAHWTKRGVAMLCSLND